MGTGASIPGTETEAINAGFTPEQIAEFKETGGTTDNNSDNNSDPQVKALVAKGDAYLRGELVELGLEDGGTSEERAHRVLRARERANLLTVGGGGGVGSMSREELEAECEKKRVRDETLLNRGGSFVSLMRLSCRTRATGQVGRQVRLDGRRVVDNQREIPRRSGNLEFGHGQVDRKRAEGP